MTIESVGKDSATEYLVVFCTSPNQSQAETLATGIVERSLAACINLIPKMISVYHWQGQVIQDEEVLMVIKTQQRCYAQLEAFIRQNHSYEIPEIIAIPILSGSLSYLDWISQETQL